MEISWSLLWSSIHSSHSLPVCQHSIPWQSLWWCSCKSRPFSLYKSVFLTLFKLWCWISPKWNVLRIAVFYGPVWIVILLTIFIYIRVGMVVFRWRKQLLSLDNSGPKGSSGHRSFAMKDIPSPADMSQPRYEVTITSQVPHSPADWKSNMTSPRNTYREDSGAKSPTSVHARFSSLPDAGYPPPHNVVVQRPPIRVLDANKATLSYCKTAMLFFFALLCTWYVD